MAIQINDPSGCTLTDVRQIKVSGLPGAGSHTLAIILELTNNQTKSETFLRNVAVRLELGGNEQRMIGFAIPEQGQSIRIIPGHQVVGFRFVLAPGQLEAIETIRSGGDLKLKLWFTGEVVEMSTPPRTTGPITALGEYLVRQQEWIGALERMGYRKTLLFEFPLPDDEEASERATHIIKEAQNHLLRGQYDECVGKCRNLIEAYPPSNEHQSLLQEARRKQQNREQKVRESMEIPERLAILRDAVRNATHLAHHYNPGSGYSRDQAKAVLGAAVAVLSLG